MSDFGAAMRSIINRPFVSGPKYIEQQLRADRNGAHPDILEFEKRLVTRMRKQGVPLFSSCVWRNEGDQVAAFIRGHSKARWGESAHNYGMAADIIHGVLAYNLDTKAWALLGHIGKEISMQSGIAITWGGDWKFWDPAHWELKEWKLAKASRKPGQRWEPLGLW